MSTILFPIEWVMAWIMSGWHTVLTALGMPRDSGWTWLLVIVGLVLVVRTLMIPLFVKQIRSTRKMQIVQPEVMKIQAKYKGMSDQESRQKMLQETMSVYKKEGTSPYASCFPLLIQMPIFFALFRTLSSLGDISAGKRSAIGPLDQELASLANNSTLLGSALSDRFTTATSLEPRIFTIVLVVLMGVTQFLSQRQLTMKNMPPSALEGPMGQTQKIMLYAMPPIFAISGVAFPLGVLFYWFVSNIWSMVQQYYVIRRMPTMGSPAYEAWLARQKAKGKAVVIERGLAKVVDKDQIDEELQETTRQVGQRPQPKKRKPKKR